METQPNRRGITTHHYSGEMAKHLTPETAQTRPIISSCAIAFATKKEKQGSQKLREGLSEKTRSLVLNLLKNIYKQIQKT